MGEPEEERRAVRALPFEGEPPVGFGESISKYAVDEVGDASAPWGMDGRERHEKRTFDPFRQTGMRPFRTARLRKVNDPRPTLQTLPQSQSSHERHERERT